MTVTRRQKKFLGILVERRQHPPKITQLVFHKLIRTPLQKMVAFTILRQATRATAGPARLVAGMRVSLVSSASSCSARPIVSKLSSNAVRGVGVRAFSGSARRFGSGTSEWFPVPTHILSNSFICVADVSLSQRLQEELNYEQDAIAQTGDSTAEFLKTFLEQGIWSVSYPFFFLSCIL